MLTNYIKLAWRNIRRHPLHSFINIIGLSAGIAFSFLVGAYAWTEWKVDRQLKNSSRQYILQSKWKDPHLGIDLTTPGPLAWSPTIIAGWVFLMS